MNHRLVRQRALPRGVFIFWSALLTLLAFLTGLAKILDENLGKKSWPWIHKPHTQLWFGIALAVVVFADSLRRTIVFARAGSKGSKIEQQHAVHNVLASAIAAVCDFVPVKPGDLGCGLFLRHRTLFPRLSGSWGQAFRRSAWSRDTRLIRVERVRLLDAVPPSGVTFRTGVGTVGTAWANNHDAYQNWSAINRRYAGGPPTEEVWNKKIPEKTHHGFGYRDWITMLGRYVEVLAVPVMVGDELIGVLALDRKWHDGDTPSDAWLNSAQVRQSVGGIARALEPVLGGKR